MEDQSDVAEHERVTESEQISDILSKINRHLVHVSVRLDADGPVYDSRLSGVDPERQVILLEALSPPDERSGLTPGQNVLVFASLRGSAMRFSLTVEEVVSGGAYPVYRGNFPREILFLRRRDLLRVHVPLYEHRQVSVRCGDAEREMVARVVDLSVRGFCLEIPETEIQSDQIGSRFVYFGMDLPESRTLLSGDAVLINLRPSPRPGFLSAGFAILDLDPVTERALMRAALYYQREARKLGS